MNKYEQAFHNICDVFNLYDTSHDSELKLFNELVERATSEKVKRTPYDDYIRHTCPKCNNGLSGFEKENYCGDCGQALLWED